jgi:hypothetical protein
VALLDVAHAARVRFHLRLPQALAPSFRVRLEDLAQGRISWDD